MQAMEAGCAQNMSAIYKATTIYATQNDARLPPAYATNFDGTVALFNDVPFTWVSLVQPALSERASFICPASTEEEWSLSDHPSISGETIPSSYGMYVAWSGRGFSDASNPSQAVLFSETTTNGARETFNPLPLLDGNDQEIPNDGFLIAYETANYGPEAFDEAFLQIRESEFVTRLSFYGSANGQFPEDLRARHPKGNHVIFLDGSLGYIRAPAARIQKRRPDEPFIGFWATR